MVIYFPRCSVLQVPQFRANQTFYRKWWMRFQERVLALRTLMMVRAHSYIGYFISCYDSYVTLCSAALFFITAMRIVSTFQFNAFSLSSCFRVFSNITCVPCFSLSSVLTLKTWSRRTESTSCSGLETTGDCWETLSSRTFTSQYYVYKTK